MRFNTAVLLRAGLVLSLLASYGCRTASSAVMRDGPPPTPAPAAGASSDDSAVESSPRTLEPGDTGSEAADSEVADSGLEPGAPKAAGAEEPYKNTIKWTTATEVDNFGFDVYRSGVEDGPFDKINAEIIEGAGTTDEPTRYEFVDDTIDPTREYYYYIESVSMSGVREQFTPIGKIRAKKPLPNEAESEGGSDGVR